MELINEGLTSTGNQISQPEEEMLLRSMNPETLKQVKDDMHVDCLSSAPVVKEQPVKSFEVKMFSPRIDLLTIAENVGKEN